MVGFGIKFFSHLTTETIASIEKADKVLYLVNDPVVKDWIQKANPCTESLEDIYFKHSSRSDTYCAIADYILETLSQNQNLCVVFYGHPTVFADPGIMAVKKAREKGIDARVFPGISAEACLFSDLLINPGSCGCQSFEATDFLIYDRIYSPKSHLILWQVGFIGAINHPGDYDNSVGINLLYRTLSKNYPSMHEVILYEAAQYPSFEPRIEKILLKELPQAKIEAITTLYLPPAFKAQRNNEVLEELGIILK